MSSSAAPPAEAPGATSSQALEVAGTAASYFKVGAGVAASYGGAAFSSLKEKAKERWRSGGTDAQDVSLRGLASADLLKIAAALDGIFSSAGAEHIRKPELPRLVVVGTQSSGKSSLLNGIMGADILPLGEQMVTRAPLSLQLIHTPDPSAMRAEFGDFRHGGWVAADKIVLTCPDPTPDQLAKIRAAIDAQTATRAGTQKGVSTAPILMRLYSPHVPDLSLVDLPGLTMTALTAQGQPKDIKEQIRGMVGSYIAQERTIILMVCPARADLEADPAVELAREHDPQGKRTVGVLTKVDLMNAGTDVSSYLTNTAAADLQLSLGYFACKMRGPAESQLSVRDGFGSEEAFFAAHPSYGRQHAPFGDRLGVPHLTSFLSRVLLQHVRQHMPNILNEVMTLHAATERKLAEIGQLVPPDEASRSALVQNHVATFARDYVGSLVEKRADVKTGRRIKDAFNSLNEQLRAVSPFDPEHFSDAYLLEAVGDTEGNHLSLPIPPIELIEHMLTHPERRPVRQLLPPCLGCLAKVHDELRELCSSRLRVPHLARFPKLQAKLTEEVEALLERERANTQAKLEELIAMEEAYIYTDDEKFLAELQSAIKKLVTRLDPPLLRSVLNSYYGTVTRAVINAAPKAIMLHLVRASQEGVYRALFDALSREPLQGLLDEPDDVEAKRRADLELLEKLRSAKSVLEKA